MNLQQSANDRAEQLTADRLSVEKFAVGQSVPRKEDPMLLRGQGHYTDDISLPGQAYAVMVRSQNAHGVIRSIDTEAAKKMPGVLGVYTAADLKGYGPLKCIVPFNNRDGSPMKKPLREALAVDKVRYVGDPVAYVVAETVLPPRTPPKRSSSISNRCLPSPRRKPQPNPARRSSTTTCRAMWRSIITMATPKRSTPPSPRPPTSPSCNSSTAGSWSPPWSRAPRSPPMTASASRSMSARRACSACAPISPKRSA